MADIVVTFSGQQKQIGLIVRGKQSPTHHPDKLAQHADAILSDGSPIGFYGEGNDASGNAIGMRMQGVVYDYAALNIHRPWYVNVKSAIANRVVSTVLLIGVDKKAADLFTGAWEKMTLSPGDFNIVGGNCSTHASAAFIAAGMVDTTIPWLDTPDNLYSQLVDTIPKNRQHSYTGFIGFDPNPAGGYRLIIHPYVAAPTVNAPNPGKSGSLATNGSSFP
jgi:hypothetical protein